tara:strand:+ start:3671 stop:4054 length:384 start_codon:yes stop_codon:yes gene_type:complete
MSETRSPTEQAYWDALFRLRERGEVITYATVAAEADKTLNDMRRGRYPDLYEAMDEYIELQKKKAIPAKTFKAVEKIAAKDEELTELKENYEKALNKILCLEMQVIDLQQKLDKYMPSNNVTQFRKR